MSAFQQLGDGSLIQPGGTIEGAEHISIGSGVFVRAPYWLKAAPENQGESMGIRMEDGCQCNMGLTIEAFHSVVLERQVLTGLNVYLTDRPPMGAVNGNPFEMLPPAPGSLRIGEGSFIGTGAVIAGHLRIGKGCVVKPNSVVLADLPDYCMAGGNPAVVTELYVPSRGGWVPTSDSEETERLLAERRDNPLLSICIPTFNRAPNLHRCLQTILSQIGNCPLVEVDVSDNASTDYTQQVVKGYMQLYTNIRYSRNDHNIGADANILLVTARARGKFIKLQGDDDFFVEGTILPLLNVLHRHPECGLLHINVLNTDGRVYSGEGAQSFLADIGYAATFITSTVYRRVDWRGIKHNALFLGSALNHLYNEFALLSEINPKYVIMNCGMFTYTNNEPRGYNFGEVFVRGYLNILRHFADTSLSVESIRRDKQRLLRSYLMPWYRRIRMMYDKEITAGFVEVFTEYYGDEPYCEEALSWFRSIE